MATTTQLFKALQQLPDENAAQTITDYLEEGKQVNMDRMKEVFATKEDLSQVRNELLKDSNANFKWTVGIVVGIMLSVGSVIVGLLLKIISQLP
jgi:CHASE3 domain sensor protein